MPYTACCVTRYTRMIAQPRKTLEQTSLAAIGRMTMSTKERVVLIHHYRGAIVATALRYPYEVRDLFHIPELENLPGPDEEGWL
jgi:non-homologous end joining protein Ku